MQPEQITMQKMYDGEVLGVESPEEWLRRNKSSLRHCRICHRTTISGEYVESDIYPVWGRHDIPRAAKVKESRKAQRNLNNKNAKKKVIRLVQGNFGKGDLIMTLTYEDHYYPDESRAKKDMDAFIKALRRERKKQGLPDLKYLYVIEYVPEGEDTKKVRIHHHIIINAMDRDIAESKWKKGRVESKYADPDKDFGLEGYAHYITKTGRKGHHMWSASRNLKKPVVHETTTRLNKKQLYDLAMSGDGIGQTMEAIYRGRCRYLDSKVYYSDYVGGFYIYSRLKKREGVSIVCSRSEQKRSQSEQNRSRSETKRPIPGTECNLREPAKTDKPECKIYITTTWSGEASGGTGGYAVVNEVRTSTGAPVTGERYGAVVGTTRDRLHLKALITALKQYTMPCRITIHCKSYYLHCGINEGKFKAQEDENRDLVKKLLDLADRHEITVDLTGVNPYSSYELDRLQKKIKAGEVEIETDEREG